MRITRLTIGAAALAVLWALAPVHPAADQQRATTYIAATTADSIRAWDGQIDRRIRDGRLRRVRMSADTLVEGRTHERLQQVHANVPVAGSEVVRQLEEGVTVSVFGALQPDLDLETTPAITAEQAAAIMEERAGNAFPPGNGPSLVVLPLDGGGHVLAWQAQLRTAALDLVVYFVDAADGRVLLEYSNLKTQQAAVGRGVGVLGDDKKVSASRSSGGYQATDRLRPPTIVTYDMNGDYLRVLDCLDGRAPFVDSDVASDSDNTWDDPAVVDGHAHVGVTYDYFYKRFNRRGLDDRNRPLKALVHPVNRSEVFTLFSRYSLFFTNAFWDGSADVMVFGEGLPPNVTVGGRRWNYTSAALDIVAHELAHGVTDYSSNLIYRNESGALNEAFSDIMAVGAEFFAHAAGSGLRRADYVIGEDAVSGSAIRSLATPGVNGDPDHYSRRYIGEADNGGVHTNSTIGGHAFYLAVEGGTNLTSGLAVQGVGAANREQIEKAFYRAFVYMMPSNSTFAMARAATIQAARDLYGAGSAAEQAIARAWSAVGVE
ncbi:MAG: M4 family metallopeptidase [Vicinamibacterales bacterium]